MAPTSTPVFAPVTKTFIGPATTPDHPFYGLGVQLGEGAIIEATCCGDCLRMGGTPFMGARFSGNCRLGIGGGFPGCPCRVRAQAKEMKEAPTTRLGVEAPTQVAHEHSGTDVNEKGPTAVFSDLIQYLKERSRRSSSDTGPVFSEESEESGFDDPEDTAEATSLLPEHNDQRWIRRVRGIVRRAL